MSKIKVLTIGDHPMAPTGVGIQTKNMIEGLLDSGKFSVVSLGGAVSHTDKTPKQSEEYGEDWRIVWLMTDPRYWEFLWQIEDEIRPLAPIVYYHVWDNYPAPKFNGRFYDSNDVVVSISKLTSSIVDDVSPSVERYHIPHAVDTSVFKKISENDVARFREQHLGEKYKDQTIFFWNNRNTKRKQGGTLVWWFKEFLDEVGHDKACLIMHTNPKEVTGPDLEIVTNEAGLGDGQVLLSPAKYELQRMAMLYNMADCTINISDAEGFGLSTLESLACETPIIVTMTGGLQEQVTDGKENFGVGIEPASRAIIGTQKVPYIYEDRISKEDFLRALKTIYNMTPEERAKMGKKGSQHVNKNYSFESYKSEWVSLLEKIHQNYGSWDTRKGYERWELQEVA